MGLAVGLVAGCLFLGGSVRADPTPPGGTLTEPDLRECSGIDASQTQAGVYWVHNDSGNAPDLFAVDGGGRTLGRWRLATENRDWEDIAVTPQALYVADTGNNSRKRTEVQVHQVTEPRVGEGVTNAWPVSQTWRLAFPGEPFDCESLFIDGDHGYLVEKTSARPAGLYRFALGTVERQVLERIGTILVEAAICGADYDPESRRLVVVHACGFHVFQVGRDLLPVDGAPVKEVVSIDPSREACCFVAGGVLTASESREVHYWSPQQIESGVSEVPDAVRVVIGSVPGDVRVDGVLGDWDESRNVPLDALKGSEGSARLWMAWSSNGLYVAGQVPDPEVTVVRGAWYDGDCVEVFVGRDSEGRSGVYGPGDDRCYLAFEAGAEGRPTGKVFWPRSGRTETDRAGAEVATVVDARGYVFEMFLPWPEGLAIPEGGTGIRLACSILSAKPRRNWFVGCSNRDGVWASPLLWARAKLVR
jgi:hypothetical protein